MIQVQFMWNAWALPVAVFADDGLFQFGVGPLWVSVEW